MISYKQWKLVNESVLPSFNLGLGRATNLGIQSQFGLDEAKAAKKKKKKMVDDELVKPGKKADKPGEDDEPEVDVDVDGHDDDEDEGDDDDGDKEECGSYCAKCAKSKKKCSMCSMMAKKKMASDEDNEEEEDHDEDEEDHDEEDHDEEDHDEDEEDHDEDMKKDAKYCKMSKKKMGSDEDHDDDEESHDEEDHDEGEEDHDDEESHDEGDGEEVEAPKMSKKMMLKGGQHKLDVNKDGKIDGKDFQMMRMKKKGAKHKKGSKKKNESQAWWDSVNSMLGSNPDHKYSDGCDGLFTPVDMNNLHIGVRE